MKRSLRRSLSSVGAAIVLVGSALGAAPAQAAPIVNPNQWVQGTLGFNTYRYCDGYTCLNYFMVSNKVSRWGPIGNETATPKVGERFYLHAYTAIVSPFTLNDSYKMRLLLPTGLTPDIRSNTDVQCATTDTAFNLTRQIGPAECQDPVQVGIQWEFPDVALSKGEVINFFVPVVADRTFDGSQRIQPTSLGVTNPYNLLPNPVLSQLGVVVDPAPSPPPSTPPPGTGGTGTGGTGTSQGPVSVKAKAVAKRSKLKVTVSPNLGAGRQWTVRVGKKQGKSWKTLSRKYTTKGGKVVINLPKGVYRAGVVAAHGYAGSTSGGVRPAR